MGLLQIPHQTLGGTFDFENYEGLVSEPKNYDYET